MKIFLMSVFGWSWEVETEEAGGEDAELKQDDGNAGCDDDSHGGADLLLPLCLSKVAYNI